MADNKELTNLINPLSDSSLVDISHEEDSLQWARQVLTRVVSTTEENLILSGDLNRIGPFSGEDIRRVASIAITDLIDTHPHSCQQDQQIVGKASTGQGIRWAQLEAVYHWKGPDGRYGVYLYQKDFPPSGIRLSINFTPTEAQEETVRNYYQLTGNMDMDMSCGSGLLIAFPLKDLQGLIPMEIDSLFKDERERKRSDNASYADLHFALGCDPKGDVVLSVARKLMRGVRCLFANILEWDKPEVILPEDLDTLNLIGRKTSKLLPNK